MDVKKKGFIIGFALGALISFLFVAGIVLWQLGVFKPAVYLYPKEDMYVSVKVEMNGRLTKTIPEYKDGWAVFATKDGLIDGRYDYLFYEGVLNHLERPQTGWIVEYQDLGKWFDEKLPALGLNEKEAEEFKRYWTNKLPESRYYQIGLLSDEFLKEDMNLIVEPEPDTEIRLIFYFKPLDEKIDLPEPVITKKERKGFTVVEWGGVIDLNPLDRIILNIENLIH